MVFPGLPNDDKESRRRLPVERGNEDEDDDFDISNIRRAPPGDLTTGDWLLCIFCSGIACIIGIVRLIQGKPGAGKMVGIAFLFSLMWGLLRALLEAAMQH